MPIYAITVKSSSLTGKQASLAARISVKATASNSNQPSPHPAYISVSMAPPSRTTDAELEQLCARAPQLSFYQALLALERLLPGSVPLGQEGPAVGEQIRIRPSASLAHPVADLERIERLDAPGGDGSRIQVTATGQPEEYQESGHAERRRVGEECGIVDCVDDESGCALQQFSGQRIKRREQGVLGRRVTRARQARQSAPRCVRS